MKFFGAFLLFLLLTQFVFSQTKEIEHRKYKLKCDASSIEYYETKKLKQCVLVEEQKIQDLMCIGLVEFHKNGKINSCRLSFEQYLQSIPIKHGPDNPLYLYGNGKPKEFTLGRTVYLHTKKYKKGTRIAMDLTGAVEVLE